VAVASHQQWKAGLSAWRQAAAIMKPRSRRWRRERPETLEFVVEAAVARVWVEVLGCEGIGPGENFFDLGGDSLRAMEVISRLRAELKVELPLVRIFEDPTIQHLAAVICELQAAGTAMDSDESSAANLAVTTNRTLPLSFAQLTFWLLQQRDPQNYLYNEPRILRIRGPFQADILERSLNEILPPPSGAAYALRVWRRRTAASN